MMNDGDDDNKDDDDDEEDNDIGASPFQPYPLLLHITH